MASFPAEILLKIVGANKAEQEVKKLEKSLSKVTDAAQNIAVGTAKGGLKLATRNVNDYIKTLGKLDKRLGGLGGRLADVAKAFDFGGKTVVGVAGLNALSSALQGLPRWAGGANDALQGFASALQQITAPISVVTDAVQALGPAGVATAGGIAAATAAVMAFGPAIRRAGKQAEDFKKSFSGSFEVTQDILSEKTIRDALSAAVSEQKKLSAGTREYTEKTEEVLAIQRELTAELRRQQTVLNMVNKEQIDIANNVKRNINASAATRQASGFADFSQRAGAQTAIDKSIARARAKRIEQASRALPDVGKMPLALPSSEMLNAAERGIKQIRSVTDQLGKDLDYTNQEVANFINGLKNGANEAVKLPPIFNKVAQSLDVINSNFDEAVAKSRRLAGGPAGGTGSTTPIQGRTAALRKLADLEKKLIAEVAQTRANKDLQSYNTRQKRIRYLAKQEEEAAKKAAQRRESLFLGVGFPLLFGGGAGSVLGSAAGSFGDSGGGFGGQIIGGAIGQAIDNFVTKTAELGQALNPLTADVDAVATAAGLTGTELGNLIKKLEEAGDKTTALAIATKELENVVGIDGVAALQAFGEQAQMFSNLLIEEATKLSAALAKFFTLPKDVLSDFERGDLLRDARSSNNAAIRDAVAERDFAASTFAGPEAIAELEERIITLMQEQIQLRQELTQESIAAADAKANELDAALADQRVAQAQLALLRLEGDLTSDVVYEQAKKVELLRYYSDIQTIVDSNLSEELKKQKMITAEIEYRKRLEGIEIKRTKILTGGAGRRSSGVDRAAEKLERQLKAGEKLARQFRQRVEILKAENKLQENLIRITQKREEVAIRIKETAAASQQSELLAANAELLRLERIKAIEAFTKKTVESVEQYTGKINDQIALREREEALIRDGLNPQLAAAYATIEQQADKQREILEERIKNLDAAIQQLEIDGASAEELEKQRKELERIKGLRGDIDDAEDKAKGQATKDNPGKIQSYIDQLQTELQDTEGMIVSLAQSIQSAMGTAIASAVSSLVTGAQTIEQTLSNMFKAIGEAFIKMAAEIIAKQLIMIALQSILKALGGGGPTMSNGTTVDIGSVDAGTIGSLGGLGSIGGGYKAQGGSVGANRPYIVGERGPELFIPQQSGRVMSNGETEAALERYNPATSAPMNMKPIDVQYNVTEINSMRFVTEEQMIASSRQAAKQGAKQGERQVYASLRNSRSRRSKLGM